MKITTPFEGSYTKSIYVFKKTFLAKSTGNAYINVFSPSPYKLFIDDTLIFCGPQKAINNSHFDIVCLTEYLKNGENEIVIEIMAEGKAYLDVWGEYQEDADKISLDSDASWQVSIKSSSKLTEESFGLLEEYTPISLLWKNAVEIGKSERDNLLKRTISPLSIKMRCLNLIQDGGNTYDASETTAGYIRLNYSGKGTIKLVYKKSFASYKDTAENELYDIINCENEGTWEGFSKRFFRFIDVQTTGSANVDYIYYYESTYPLNASVTYDFSKDEDNKLYKAALRTLQCCAQDVYYDAPYIMEEASAKSSYLQALYTFNISHDVALVKNFLQSFDFNDYSFENMLYFTLLLCEYYEKYGDEQIVLNNIDKVVCFLNDNVKAKLSKKEKLLLRLAAEKSEILFKLADMDIPPLLNGSVIDYNLILNEMLESYDDTETSDDFILLRLLEMSDRYNERDFVLKKYYKHISNGYTTIPEFSARVNDCSGKNAIVLYEFNVKDLGVSWQKNKFKNEIYIKPFAGSRNEAKGKVTTAFGDVFVEWKNGSKFFVELYMPDSVKKIITLPDGKVIETNDSYYISE